MKTILAKLIWDVNASLATLAVCKAIAESRQLCKSRGTVLHTATVIHRGREVAERELALNDQPRGRTRQVFGPERPVQSTDWQLHVDRVLWINYKVPPGRDPRLGERYPTTDGEHVA